MFDLIVDALGTIGDIIMDIWVNKIVSKFKRNKGFSVCGSVTPEKHLRTQRIHLLFSGWIYHAFCGTSFS